MACDPYPVFASLQQMILQMMAFVMILNDARADGAHIEFLKFVYTFQKFDSFKNPHHSRQWTVLSIIVLFLEYRMKCFGIV